MASSPRESARSLVAEIHAAIVRVRSWIWLHFLQRDQGETLGQLHKKLGFHAGDRGPLYDVMANGADPGRSTKKSKSVLTKLAAHGYNGVEAAAYSHPVFQALLSGSKVVDLDGGEFFRVLERHRLALLTPGDQATLAAIGLDLVQNGDDEENPPVVLARHLANVLANVPILDKLFLNIVMLLRSHCADGPTDSWQLLVDATLLELAPMLPPEHAIEGVYAMKLAIDLAVEKSGRLTRLSNTELDSIDALERTNAWLDAFEGTAIELCQSETLNHIPRQVGLADDEGQSKRTKRKIEKFQKVERIFAASRRREKFPETLVQHNPWLNYLTEHRDLIDEHLQYADSAAMGTTDDVFGVAIKPPCQPLPPAPKWPGRRVNTAVEYFGESSRIFGYAARYRAEIRAAVAGSRSASTSGYS